MATEEPQCRTAGIFTAIRPICIGPTKYSSNIDEGRAGDRENHFAVTPKGQASAQHAFPKAARLGPFAVTAVYCKTVTCTHVDVEAHNVRIL